MSHQYQLPVSPIRLCGRPRTAQKQSWTRTVEGPDGADVVIEPMPGATYTRQNWPPRNRGRGESLTSARRIQAKLRAAEVLRLRRQGHTYDAIARRLGFADPSGAYRAQKRLMDRIDWDQQRKEQLREERRHR